MTKMIKVWRFYDAPKKYRKMSVNGGDEDWVVLVPKELTEDNSFYALWIDHIDTCMEPDEFTLKNGDKIYIGSHA